MNKGSKECRVSLKTCDKAIIMKNHKNGYLMNKPQKKQTVPRLMKRREGYNFREVSEIRGIIGRS